MKIELRILSMQDGKEIFEMIKEIGPGENGFGNKDYAMTMGRFFEIFRKKYILF